MQTNNELIDRVQLLRDSGAVRRFHILRTNNTQTVAEHSYGVATLVMLIEPKCSATLLKAALTHDAHERDTGDTPSTAKWRYRELAAGMKHAEMEWQGENTDLAFESDLELHEKLVLRFCDWMELAMWSVEQIRMGNQYATEPLKNILDAFDQVLNWPDKCVTFLNAFIAREADKI